MTALVWLDIALFLLLAAAVWFVWRVLRNGWLMERLTAFCLARLGKRHFRVYNNVILPDGEGGTTQIDHIVVCSGGLYCVETKGWGTRFDVARCEIYASPKEARWKIYYKDARRRTKGSAFVGNPLRQNYKHHLCLAAALDIPPEAIHPMVVLPANCHLRKGVTIEGLFSGPLSLVRAIHRQAHGSLFPKEKLADILRRLDTYKTASTRKAAKAHEAYLKEKFSSDRCPRCGGQLVERVGRKGGTPFLGCSNFPRCRYLRQLKPPRP